MRIAVITTSKDIASLNLQKQLLASTQFSTCNQKEKSHSTKIKNIEIELFCLDEFVLDATDLDERIKADVFIFLHKHRAEEGRPTLTVHPIGNFNLAEHGGKEKMLCPCPSFLFKSILKELMEAIKNSGYEATVEATHHGPYVHAPALFLELGSTEKEWQDEKGARLVCTALLNALENFDDKKENTQSVIVLGGGHYGHVPNKTMLETEYAVGHICPKHNLPHLDRAMLQQMMEKTIPKPEFAVLDWKGLGSEKQRILSLLTEMNIEFKRSDQFFR